MKITRRQLRALIREQAEESEIKSLPDSELLQAYYDDLDSDADPEHVQQLEDELYDRGLWESRNRNLRVSAKQLRRIIRESLLLEQLPGDTHAGYMVPNFETEEDMMLFIDELEPDDQVMKDVVNPETGEIEMEAGQTPLEAGLVEVEPEPEETKEDELDQYDWDAWEREREAEREAQNKLDDEMQEKIRQEAIAGGKDWGADTLYQARENPDMWQRGDMGNRYDSPEEYVEGFGQDAAADVAQGLEYTFNSNEEFDWYRSLPTREPDWRAADAGRPTQQNVKDLYADYFYDGVTQAVRSAKEAA